MKKLIGILLLSVIAGCADYQEPQANCFSFVSRGPAPMDCNFEALVAPNLEEVANE